MRVVFTVLDALPPRHVGHDAHAGAAPPRAGRWLGAGPGARGHDLGHVPQPRDLQHRHAAARRTASSPTGCRRPGRVGAGVGARPARCRRCSTRAAAAGRIKRRRRRRPAPRRRDGRARRPTATGRRTACRPTDARLDARATSTIATRSSSSCDALDAPTRPRGRHSSTGPTPPRTCTAPTATPRSRAIAKPTRGSRPSREHARLGRHGLDHRVGPRPGGRRPSANRSTCKPRSTAVAPACSRCPEGNASVVCGDGANDAARVARARSTAWKAAPRSRSPMPGSSAASCGPSQGARSGSPARPRASAPTAGRARARRSPWSRAATRPSRCWRATLERAPVDATDWAPTIAELLGIALPHATGRSLLA